MRALLLASTLVIVDSGAALAATQSAASPVRVTSDTIDREWTPGPERTPDALRAAVRAGAELRQHRFPGFAHHAHAA